MKKKYNSIEKFFKKIGLDNIDKKRNFDYLSSIESFTESKSRTHVHIFCTSTTNYKDDKDAKFKSDSWWS